MIKKILAAVLVGTMVFTAIAQDNMIVTMADDYTGIVAQSGNSGGKCGANLTWTLEEGTLTISGTGDMSNNMYDWSNSCVNQPWDSSAVTNLVIEDGVTSIGMYAFSECNGLTSVSIPGSVTRIGSYAFAKCENLKTVVLSEGVSRVDRYTFSDCGKLDTISLPDTINGIERGTFKNCSSLENISFPQGIRYIGEEAFYGTALTEVVLPATVYVVGRNAFASVSALTAIKFGYKDCVINDTFSLASEDVKFYSGKDGRVAKKAEELGVTFVEMEAAGSEGEPIDNNIVVDKRYDLYQLKGETLYLISLSFNDAGEVEVALPAYSKEEVPDYRVSVEYNGVMYYEFGGMGFGCRYVINNSELLLLDYDKNSLTAILVPDEEGKLKVTYWNPESWDVIKDEIFIEKKVQTVSAKDYTKTFGDDDFTITASTTGDGRLSYYSSDEKVATVDSNGKVSVKGVGTATITISASNTVEYSEAVTEISLTVNRKALDASCVSLEKTSYIYDGKAKTPKVTVKDKKGNAIPASDYNVAYIGNTNAGTATVKVTMKSTGNYSGTLTKTFAIGKANNSITATESYTKTASAKAQSFFLNARAAGGNLSYKSDNKSVTVNSTGKVTIARNFAGKAVITITAAGSNHKTATKKVTITVNPAKTKVTSAKNTSAKKATIKWGKLSYVSGYQIQYGTKSNFSGAKSVTVNGATKVSRVLSKLTKRKTYYVRVRAYKTVGKTKIYGAWSAKKSVKITK